MPILSENEQSSPEYLCVLHVSSEAGGELFVVGVQMPLAAFTAISLK